MVLFNKMLQRGAAVLLKRRNEKMISNKLYLTQQQQQLNICQHKMFDCSSATYNLEKMLLRLFQLLEYQMAGG